jgi:hypothetical protein
MDRRLANLERIAPPPRNSLPLHEWIARTEQEGWADVISVTFSNGQRTGYARGRAGFLEKLAELKRAGLIDDETGVEFTITHTFVNPPKRVVGLGPWTGLS